MASFCPLHWTPKHRLSLRERRARMHGGTLQPTRSLHHTGKHLSSHTSRRHWRSPIKAQQGGDDLDVAVFRFTLGIPGFDDSRIPQVVGAVVAALVAANHVFGSQPTPAPQVRAEFLTILLAVLCFSAPEIETRLREASSSRGRQASAASMAGSTQVFALDSGLDQGAKTELAWLSRSLLVNANCCTVAAVLGAGAVMARGAVAADAAAGATPIVLNTISNSFQSSSPPVAAVMAGTHGQLWCPDKGAMTAAGAAQWSWLPAGAQCLLLVHVPAKDGGGLMAVVGDRERSLSVKDQKWISAMAYKLGGGP